MQDRAVTANEIHTPAGSFVDIELMSTDVIHSFWVPQRPPAKQPATDVGRDGEQTFLSHQCAQCHSIRRTDAMGTVGPDLMHLAGRRHIAGYFDNDAANLEAWVMHAQSLKPGAYMPNLTQFKGPELRALVTYLQTLK